MPRGYHNDFAVTENSKPLSGQEGTTPSYPQARSTGLSNTFNMHMQLAINSYISHQLPLKCKWSLQNQLSRLNGRNFFASFRRTETKGRRARFAPRARLAFATVRLTEIRKKIRLYHLGNTIPLFLSTLFSNYQLHNFSYVAPKVERIPAYINRASINWR